MPWQALYYHDGESVFCTQYVSQWDYSGLNIGGKSYFNTPTHPPGSPPGPPAAGVVAYEHTEFTSGPEIRQAAGNAGIGLTYDYDATFFPFADYRTGETVLLEGCQGARDVTVRHSAGYQSAFHYSDPDKVYRMEMYSSRTGRFEPAVDELNSQQLAFENLLVCFAPHRGLPRRLGGTSSRSSTSLAAKPSSYPGTGAALPVVQAGPRPAPGSDRQRPAGGLQPRPHLSGHRGRGRTGCLRF